MRIAGENSDFHKKQKNQTQTNKITNTNKTITKQEQYEDHSNKHK